MADGTANTPKVSKKVSFNDVYIYHGPIEHYEKYIEKPAVELWKTCQKCRAVMQLDLDLFKSTKMTVHPECEYLTRFHSDDFRTAKTLYDGDYEYVILEQNLKMRCRKHRTQIEYREL